MTVVSTPVETVGLGGRRQALRDEHERVLRWRRVVRARLDLAVAVAVPPGLLAVPPELAADSGPQVDVPAAAELAPLLRDRAPALEIRALSVLRALDVRLAAYEKAIGTALRSATDAYVEELAQAPAERSRLAARLTGRA